MFQTVQERLMVVENKIETLEEVCKDIRHSLKSLPEIEKKLVRLETLIEPLPEIERKLIRLETLIEQKEKQKSFYWDAAKWIGLIILSPIFVSRLSFTRY